MKWSPQIIKAICEHIEMGVSNKDAAALEGISEDTFYAWMKKVEFSEPLKKARLKDKARSVKLITKAGLTKWQANAWKLERSYPEEYALRARFEHTGKGGRPLGGPSYDHIKKLTDEELERKAYGDQGRQKRG